MGPAAYCLLPSYLLSYKPYIPSALALPYMYCPVPTVTCMIRGYKRVGKALCGLIGALEYMLAFIPQPDSKAFLCL